LIGSIRRECTDHLIVFNAEHLRRILTEYAAYYNEVRTHVSLAKDAPCGRPIERFGDIIAQPSAADGAWFTASKESWRVARERSSHAAIWPAAMQ